MTTKGQFYHRVQTVQDRLAWGLGDLRRRLAEQGLWPVRTFALESTDGNRWSVTENRLEARDKSGKAEGLLVPETECLWGATPLPDMPRRALKHAVEETIWRVSPLPRDQIFIAWEAQPNPQGGWTVEWGLCRRDDCNGWRVERALASDSPVFLARQGRALPVRGSLPQGGRQRWHHFLAAVFGLLLLGAIVSPALMPLVFEREAVRKAVRHIVEQEPRSLPIRQKLDELRLNAELAAELRVQLEGNLPLASLVEALAQALPDDTSLDRIDVNGREVRITGLTGNTTDLIALLSRQTVFSDVRATVASVRDATLNKERFTLEMRWRGGETKP